MHAAMIEFSCLRVVRLGLGLFLAGAAVQGRAGLVRSIVDVQPGRAVVELAWAFTPAPESAMVVAEQVPAGWTAQLDADSAALVERVRIEPGTISFLIGLEALSTPGRIAYVLTQDAAEGGAAPLSGTYLKSEGVHVVSAAIAGASEFTAPADGQDPDPGADAAFKIVGFTVSGGDDPRIAISWQGGSAGQPVVVEWMPVDGGALALALEQSSEEGTVEVAPKTAGAGWQEFWAVPAVDMQMLDAGTPGEAGAESEPPTYVARPDKAAPPGLYRLRTSD